MKYITSILIIYFSFFSIFKDDLNAGISLNTNDDSGEFFLEDTTSSNPIDYLDIANTSFLLKDKDKPIISYVNPEILSRSLPSVIEDTSDVFTTISSDKKRKIINILKIFKIFLDLVKQSMDEDKISTVFPEQFNYIKQNYIPSEINGALHYYLKEILSKDLNNNIHFLLPLLINFSSYYDWDSFMDSLIKKDNLSISFSIYFSFIKLILLHKSEATTLLDQELTIVRQNIESLSSLEIKEIRYLIRKIIEKTQTKLINTNTSFKDEYFDKLKEIDNILLSKKPHKKNIFQICYEFFTL